ncbi:hypothetical protein C8R47DRAFT_233527 [Mycena vitilis]|nr:hypothetical protein C8R47DRAFT_233527 [Mycena vitilis]
MPNTVKKGTMAHPITGHRINLFSTDSTRDDKGVPDACKTCGITGAHVLHSLQSERRSSHRLLLQRLSDPRSQTGDTPKSTTTQAFMWKDARRTRGPIHHSQSFAAHWMPRKSSCTLRNLRQRFKVKSSSSRTTPLLITVSAEPRTENMWRTRFKERAESCFYRRGPRRWSTARWRASRSWRSCWRHRRSPASATPRVTMCHTQLEKEYEVDLEDCRRELEGSARHSALFEEWLEWVGPRIRDDEPELGIRFLMLRHVLRLPGRRGRDW